jgi:hypothetical protein
MKLATQTALAVLLMTTTVAPIAQAQPSTPAEKAAIEQAKAKAAGRDLSVKIKTKKQSNNPDMKESVTTTTSEVSMPEPVAAQGAPELPVIDAAQYVPVTDPESSLVYISGGIGEAEIAYFKTLRDGYSLKLVMADKAAAFVSDATVTISNATGEKIATLSGVGPYLLVKLPAGKYTLTISAGEVEVGQAVTIREGKLTALDVRL